MMSKHQVDPLTTCMWCWEDFKEESLRLSTYILIPTPTNILKNKMQDPFCNSSSVVSSDELNVTNFVKFLLGSYKNHYRFKWLVLSKSKWQGLRALFPGVQRFVLFCLRFVSRLFWHIIKTIPVDVICHIYTGIFFLQVCFSLQLKKSVIALNTLNQFNRYIHIRVWTSPFTTADFVDTEGAVWPRSALFAPVLLEPFLTVKH